MANPLGGRKVHRTFLFFRLAHGKPVRWNAIGESQAFHLTPAPLVEPKGSPPSPESKNKTAHIKMGRFVFWLGD
ncbi:hypothetical protein [Sulfuricaulis sp.]|jgi:hypothetical protein|uniref:hypothetical protein n=1 Tax=Sulfuricaulis sp. TaxID=2003553 RepID=UPI003559D5B8